MSHAIKEGQKGRLDAVFLYGGILDAYEAVGMELIGPNVVEDYVLPKMVYYVREFLPGIFNKAAPDPERLVSDLRSWLDDFKLKISRARELKKSVMFSLEEIWQLRAAIFGYESVFIDILGETAIKTYVFSRIADILSSYLPDVFLGEEKTLEEKLNAYLDYIREKRFVQYTSVRIKGTSVRIAANKCYFANIHKSEAYQKSNVRFCPWGMIGSAIITSHKGDRATIESCQFTTRGSISKIVTEK
ncbi:MAG: hypothetical protein ACFFFG_04680 [Candidatus Thorarchaeota archaeon]